MLELTMSLRLALSVAPNARRALVAAWYRSQGASNAIRWQPSEPFSLVVATVEFAPRLSAGLPTLGNIDQPEVLCAEVH
jgi:hypothetical protein